MALGRARDTMTIDEIRDNFALLDDWEDRYRYVIELGRTLKPMPEAEHSAANKVQGCASHRLLKITCATFAAAVAGPVPFFWQAANAPLHSSAQPSDSQPEGPICRGIVPASCCIACADDASAI